MLFDVFVDSLCLPIGHDQIVCRLKGGFCFPMWFTNSQSRNVHCIEASETNTKFSRNLLVVRNGLFYSLYFIVMFIVSV